MNDELCSLACDRILVLSRQILDLLDKDLIEDALELNSKRLEMIKDFTESLDGYRSETLTKFCQEFVKFHEIIMSKIKDMQKFLVESMQNRHSTAKKICAYQNVSRIGK